MHERIERIERIFSYESMKKRVMDAARCVFCQ
jgi:hypothetical protein